MVIRKITHERFCMEEMDMEIKNLAQLKRVIKEGHKFIIRKHYIKPEYEGQIRKPNVVQTNGFYSIEDGKPDSKITLANNKKGSWIEYEKASDWKFENGICKQYFRENAIWEIEVI